MTDQKDNLDHLLSVDEIREQAKEEQEKSFSTFESNRREKEKAEEMNPEAFESTPSDDLDNINEVEGETEPEA